MRVPSFLVAPAALSFAFQQLAYASSDVAFHPNSYPKKVAVCKAVNRANNHTAPVDIKLRTSIIHAGFQNTLKLTFDIYRLC